jgi:hypothetical protein
MSFAVVATEVVAAASVDLDGIGGTGRAGGGGQNGITS